MEMLLNQFIFISGIVIAYFFTYKVLTTRRLILLSAISLLSIVFFSLSFISKYPKIDSTVMLSLVKNILLCLAIWLAGFVIIGIYEKIFSSKLDRKGLNKRVIAFTRRATADMPLKMMGGDLSFFGNIDEMNNNPQYSQLLNMNFSKIQLICEPPQTNRDKIRIGKIFRQLNKIEIKFYNSTMPHLNTNFRIINTETGVSVLNFYKISTDSLYYIEVYNENGDDKEKKKSKQYESMWNLYWNNLTNDNSLIDACVDEYNNY